MSTTATPPLPIGMPNSPDSPRTKPSNPSPPHFRLPQLLKHAPRDASPHSQAMIAAMHALHLSNTLINEDTTTIASDPTYKNHIPTVSSRLNYRTTPPPASPSPRSFTLPADLVTPSTSPPSSLKSALHLPGLPPYKTVPSHSASPTSPTPNAWAEIASAPATPFVDSRSRRLAQLLNNNTNFPLSTFTNATAAVASTPSYPSLTSPLNQFTMDPWVSIAADPPTSGGAAKTSFAALPVHHNPMPFSAYWPRVRARTTSATPAQLYESHVNIGLTDLRNDLEMGSAMYMQRTNSSSYVKPSVGFCRSPKTIATAPSSPLIGNSRWLNNEWSPLSTWGDLGLVPEESGNLSANGTPNLFHDPKQFLGKNHVRSATTIPSSSTGLAVRSKPVDLGPCMPLGLSEDETLELMQLREKFANRNRNEDAAKYLPIITSRNISSKPSLPPGIPQLGSKKSHQTSSTLSFSATPPLSLESSASPPCTLSINKDLVNPAFASITANELLPNESALATAADDIAYIPAMQHPNDSHIQMTTDFHTNQNMVHAPAIHGRLESGGPVTLTQTHDPHTLTTPTIVVEMNQPPKHIYVSDLPSIVDEVILRKAFRRFGRIDDIRLSKTKMTGNLNGVAYVKFAFADSVIKALASDGDVIVSGKAIKIAPTDPTENPTRKLFFANVWDLTQDDLLPVCKQFGEVTQVDVVADRGMMYVHFKDLADAVQAHRALQGLTINNRYVRVEFGQSAANYESGGHRFHHPNQPQFHNSNPMIGSQSFPMYYHRPQTVNHPMYPMTNTYGSSYQATQPQLRPGSAPNPGSAYVHQGPPLLMYKNTPFPCDYPGAFDSYPHGMRSRCPSFNGDSTEFGNSSPYDDYAIMEYHQHSTSEVTRYAPSSRPSPRSFAYNMPPHANAYEHWQRQQQQQFQPRMYPPQVSAPIYPQSIHMDHMSLLG